jgi:hypothetical protein
VTVNQTALFRATQILRKMLLVVYNFICSVAVVNLSRGLGQLAAGLQSLRLASRLKPWLRSPCSLSRLTNSKCRINTEFTNHSGGAYIIFVLLGPILNG